MAWRGTLVVGDSIRIRMAVQVKKWKGDVQAPTVQQVRGSLGTHEQGLIVTTSDFSKGAEDEALRPNAVPVALMNGEQLVTLLAEYSIGVTRQSYDILDVDDASLATAEDGAFLFPRDEETEAGFEPGVYWAFDELFLDQPYNSTKVAEIDTTLSGWLRTHIRDRANSGRLKDGAETATFGALIALPRRISAVLMFNLRRLVDTRLNYHANRRLSHAELAALEALFAEFPAWH